MDISSSLSDFLRGQISFLANYGWPFFLVLFLVMAYKLWMNHIQFRFLMAQEYVLLAINVPEDNEKTPKVMEQAIAGFFGIQKDPNPIEKYVEGFTQPVISLELVSISGRVQYLIRTQRKFKDLVEAHIYAQYPTVEIREVDDYTVRIQKEDIPHKYNLWGSNLVLLKEDAIPIRTYKDFEEMTMEEKIVDPMAAVTEVMANIKQGEEMWFQIILKPTLDMSWKEEGEKIVKKRMGQEVESKPNTIQKIVEFIADLFSTFLKALFGPLEAEEKETKTEMFPRAAFLSPGERIALEAIERNISKLGFQTKIRFIYLAENSIFDKARPAGFMGAMHQFASLELNGFKPGDKEKTKADYILKSSRLLYKQKKILRRFKLRDFADDGFILNTEEIATIYHFPHISVKAATISRARAKRGGAPTELPVV